MTAKKTNWRINLTELTWLSFLLTSTVY